MRSDIIVQPSAVASEERFHEQLQAQEIFEVQTSTTFSESKKMHERIF